MTIKCLKSFELGYQSAKQHYSRINEKMWAVEQAIRLFSGVPRGNDLTDFAGKIYAFVTSSCSSSPKASRKRR